MPSAEEQRVPKWPVRLTLSLLLVWEVLFVVMLAMEGPLENIVMIVNSVGLIVFCALTWRGFPWSRWLLIAFLVWRAARIGVSAAAHFGPGDHRLGGSLVLMAFYVLVGALIASPLGRLRMRVATEPAHAPDGRG